MKNFTRKVLILDNLTSPYIQQAIIVLNDCATGNELKVLEEAEKIVNDYLKKNNFINENTKIYKPGTNKKGNKNKITLFIAAILIIEAIIILKIK